jgi:hypothetical protein
MNWDRLRVRDVVADGVITLNIDNSAHRLTIKPGSYPWPEKWIIKEDKSKKASKGNSGILRTKENQL